LFLVRGAGVAEHGQSRKNRIWGLMRGTQDPISQEYESSNLSPCTFLLKFRFGGREFSLDTICDEKKCKGRLKANCGCVQGIRCFSQSWAKTSGSSLTMHSRIFPAVYSAVSGGNGPLGSCSLSGTGVSLIVFFSKLVRVM
jgi:hypothetical protein